MELSTFANVRKASGRSGKEKVEKAWFACNSFHPTTRIPELTQNLDLFPVVGSFACASFEPVLG